MTDYHKDSGGVLTDFRTFLKNLDNFNSSLKYSKVTNPDFVRTIALMEELRQDLLKYKKTGSVTCKNCGLVKSSHTWLSTSRGCEGWNPK